MNTEQEYDVVIDALQEKRDRLWKMTQQNMNSEFMSMGIMDDIRLEQIDQLDRAIQQWKKSKEGTNELKNLLNKQQLIFQKLNTAVKVGFLIKKSSPS